MFEDVNNQVNFSKKEEDVLKYWEEKNIFQKTLNKNEKYFSFYDGPPFATGLPHYGHLLPNYIKDIIPRYKTMKGYRVPRRFGWDCHGLPIEMLIQNDLDLKTPNDIKKYGIEKFNQACKESVLKYDREWKHTISRIGRWVDFEKGYKTMDISFMESVWYIFKELFKKNLIYEGFKVLPYSWKASTSLSNFEANSNYKNVQDPSVTVRFQSTDEKNTYFLAWTTTPWTLLSNLALCINKEINYVKIKLKDNSTYYLSKNRLNSVFKEEDIQEIMGEFKGKYLLGKKYYPIFTDMSRLVDSTNSHQVLEANYVSDEDGTGIVHLAPYGEEDFNVLKKNNIPIYDIVDESGNFIDDISLFKGQNIKEADKNIIKEMKKNGFIVKQETIDHNYPFCWRTDTPLIYKPVSTWFVKVTALKEEMIKLNKKINWMPSHIKEGRFGKWLENIKDWDIARNRFWGTPLPIWKSQDGDILCIGSLEELKKLTGNDYDDIHKDVVDKIVIKKNSKEYRRINSVLDCWFESGSMPFAQSHYPFENKEFVEETIPADFIGEGLDQTRGWFYTLFVISTAINGEIPFKNVVVNGLILAEDGKKMSKKLKNYPSPNSIIDKYGSDALRMYIISSPAVKGEYLKFSESGVKDILKSVIIPLWNSLSFFTTYANIDKLDVHQFKTITFKDLDNPLDKWIISYQQKLISDVTTNMDNYNLQKTLPTIISFINKLTNWYIRRSRRRFWKSQNDADKLYAYSTLYEILLNLSKIIAPFMPFMAESIYLILTQNKEKESVHLEDYPSYNSKKRDSHLEDEMSAVQTVVELGRSIRSREKIKVRQPLKKIIVISNQSTIIESLEKNKDIILEELNVKDIEYTHKEEEYLDISYNPNFATLSQRFKSQMKELIPLIRSFTIEDIKKLKQEKKLNLTLKEETVSLGEEDILIVRKEKEGNPVSTHGDISIILDSKITPELLIEGHSRDVVNFIQKLRKDKNFNYTDRISISIEDNHTISNILSKHKEYIKNETLATEINIKKISKYETMNINGESINISISHAQ